MHNVEKCSNVAQFSTRHYLGRGKQKKHYFKVRLNIIVVVLSTMIEVQSSNSIHILWVQLMGVFNITALKKNVISSRLCIRTSWLTSFSTKGMYRNLYRFIIPTVVNYRIWNIFWKWKKKNYYNKGLLFHGIQYKGWPSLEGWKPFLLCTVKLRYTILGTRNMI